MFVQTPQLIDNFSHRRAKAMVKEQMRWKKVVNIEAETDGSMLSSLDDATSMRFSLLFVIFTHLAS